MKPRVPLWLVAVLAPAIVLGVGGPVIATLRRSRSRPHNIETVRVRRADLSGSILATGRVTSEQSTLIRCGLEQLNLPGPQSSLGTGASTIISLVPDGSVVKQGDLLCEMDASGYEELVRTQQIAASQARAEYVQAALALDVARIALDSYREGEQVQVERDYLGQISLEKADVARVTDRLAWSRRMLEKGYVSLAQVRSDEIALAKVATGLANDELALANYRHFTVPKELLSLQSQIISAQATLNYMKTRLNQEEDRLAHYRQLVERCTVRAPHGGYVVYANRPNREPRIYLGAPVRERMPLFTLPDQSRLEVEVLLHETIVKRVHPGMETRIRIEALSEETLRGNLESIAPVPMSDQRMESGSEVTYFLGHVQLEDLPSRLRPGMTAEVTLSTDLRHDVLAVPASTIVVEDDHCFCYMDHDGHLERRPVQVNEATRDLLEVVAGLSEGDEVVLDPDSVQPELLQQ